jgi:hypothetical protein
MGSLQVDTKVSSIPSLNRHGFTHLVSCAGGDQNERALQ